jgi:hypothetical protein
MRALNIIRGISEDFDVCGFVLYLVQLHSRSSNHGFISSLAIGILLINNYGLSNYYKNKRL